MDKDILQVILSRMGLGIIQDVPTPIAGGALHKMWRVDTAMDQYAIKELNPCVIKNLLFPNNYEETEAIAECFKQALIPAVSAIKYDGHYVHNINNKWLLVYPFTVGHLLELNYIADIHAYKVGSLFAEMHNLNLQLPFALESHYENIGDIADWQELLIAGKWQSLQYLLPTIERWIAEYNIAIPILNQELLVTHRDLHSLNVLWHHDEPKIIDWESAGLFNPMLEIVGYALEWSGVIGGVANPAIFSKIIVAYKKKLQLKHRTEVKVAFSGWLGHCVLGWTFFNLKRHLGLISQDEAEMLIGERIIRTKMSKCLAYLAQHETQLLNLVDECFL